MAMTPHLGIALLEQSQAQKEVTVNEAFYRIDALLNGGAIDRDLATPPATPQPGDVYIVAASPAGAWEGKAGQVAYFDQVWRFIEPGEGLMLWVNDENAHVVFKAGGWEVLTLSAGGGEGGGSGGEGSGSTGEIGLLCQGRLTLSSGVPVTASDVTAATTLYFTPYKGNRIALYDGTQWNLRVFGEVALTIPATANKLYDVFAYDNAGSLALETEIWTNDTTRAIALTFQDGVYVKSGAPTRRYLGSFRTTSTAGRTEDSRAKRYVWNYYNRVLRLMSALESSTWSYSGSSWRQANNNSANQIDFVQGVEEEVVSALCAVQVINSSGTGRVVLLGIGVDNASSPYGRFASIIAFSAGAQNMQAIYDDVPSAGRHYLTWLEMGAGADSQTWAGSNRFGLVGRLMG